MAGGGGPNWPPKIQGAAVFSSVWSKAKLRLEIARGQDFQPIRGKGDPSQARGKSGEMGFDSLLPEEMLSQDAPHPHPQFRPHLAVEAGGQARGTSPCMHQVVPILSR